MKTVITRSALFTLLVLGGMYIVRMVLETDAYLTDVGGLGAFVTMFGTLYGIMTAFVVFEVWAQYNKTYALVAKEAQGLERLFRLTLYFRDDTLTKQMKQIIAEYAQMIIDRKFQALSSGKQDSAISTTFRKIAAVIRDIRFNDDHDQIVFDHVVAHYGELSSIRTERITQSLARLPTLLKTFLYISSCFALISFVLMPFVNSYYGYFVTGSLTFVLAMVFHLVEDLDNPFKGYWNITPEPFERALRHIEEDY